MRVRRDKTVLVVIDLQEKFRPVVEGFDALVGSAAKLVAGSALLGVPVIATEQYPAGLGATVAEVRGCLGNAPVLEKTSFSCGGAPGFWDKLTATGAHTIMVCGIETHVCVSQSVLAMIERGLQVHIVADAMGSRKRIDHETALRKMEKAGAVPATVEMCLFELLETAWHAKFKEIQKLIK
jgi:nicotinamidase-related amidase